MQSSLAHSHAACRSVARAGYRGVQPFVPSRTQLGPCPRHSLRIVRAEPDTSEKPSVSDTPPTPPSSSSTSQATTSGQKAKATSFSSQDEEFSWKDLLASDLPKKLGVLLALIAFSRLGVYIRIPGVDVDAFAATMASSGLLGYVDTLSGGSISKVGIFSLGIIPYINSSIVLQLFAAAFPSLKKLQREEGPQGRAR
jgi:hypothetical protein